MDRLSSPISLHVGNCSTPYQKGTTIVEVIGLPNLVVVAHKAKAVATIMLSPISHNQDYFGLHIHSFGIRLCGPVSHGSILIDHQALVYSINSIGLNRESSTLLLLSHRVLHFYNSNQHIFLCFLSCACTCSYNITVPTLDSRPTYRHYIGSSCNGPQ